VDKKARSAVKKRTIVVLSFFFLTAPSLSAQTDERRLFKEADSFYEAKNYALALDSYAAFVNAYQFSELVPDAQYRRALCLFYLKRYNEALPLLEAVEKRYRSTRWLGFVPFWKGMIRFYNRDFAGAVADFDAYLAGPPDPALSAQAWYYRAVCETETGALDEAASSARRLLEDHPSSPLADYGFLLLAFVYYKRGDRDALIALYRQERAAALSAGLKDKLLLYYAGALLDSGRRDEAKAIYANLLDAAPDVAASSLAKLFGLAQQAGQVKEMESLARKAEDKLSGSPELLVAFWTNVGVASYGAGQLENAEYYFTRAWSVRDRTPVAETVPLYLSEIFSRRGNDAKALAVLEEYLAGKDGRAEYVLFRLGSLAVTAPDYPKAIGYLSDFLKQYPKSLKLAEAQYLLACAYYRTGELDKGLEVATAAADRWPDDHKLKGELVRLRARLLLKKGDAAASEAALAGFLEARKDDLATRRDYVAVLFTRKKYAEAIAAVQAAGQPAALKKADLALYLSLKYYEGLAHVSRKEYEQALASFSEFAPEYVEKRGVKEMYPSVLFYRGWAFYRMGKTAEAAPLFKSFVDQFPAHELVPRATYLAGWCLYSGGDYVQAARYFRALAERPGDKETALRGTFFLGKSLLAQGKGAEAQKLFSGIFEQSPASSFAPDALFEYARLLADQNKAAAAAAAYVRLADAYPKHPLAEEALWSRAQLFYRMNDLPKALDAFAFYRERFPSGAQVDASYYWSGLCAAGKGDRAGALGYWEKLIEGYRDSSFRSEALKKAADSYDQAGAFDKALAAYRELASAYPKEAKAVGAADKARELEYRVMGYNGREAELSARAEKEGGLGTHGGRLAMADLAELYLSGGDAKKIDLAYSLALQVASRQDDPETAARARFLLGEYFSRKKDYPKAGNEYLKAATADPANRELAARSIYQAALMMKLAGDKASARELADRLAENFPGTRWAADGKKLLEGQP
jgi:TolA-binding protein